MIASALLVLLSISRSYMAGGITTEVWAYLLLTPIPVAMALTGGGAEKIDDRIEEWVDESGDVDVDTTDEPLEMGFDVPVL